MKTQVPIKTVDITVLSNIQYLEEVITGCYGILPLSEINPEYLYYDPPLFSSMFFHEGPNATIDLYQPKGEISRGITSMKLFHDRIEFFKNDDSLAATLPIKY